MSSQINIIEHNLKALRSINPLSLDIEERAEYYQALTKILREKIYVCIKKGQYKTAVEVESEVVRHEKHYDWLVTLLSNYNPVSEGENQYLKFSQTGFDPAVFVELKSILQTIFFGVGVKVDFVGEAFILTPTINFINLENELQALTKFCKDKGLIIAKDKKNRSRYQLKDDQILIVLKK